MAEQPPAPKRVKVSTACQTCRRKRARCDGAKPTCRPCSGSAVACVYDLAGDRRKPFTKDVVQAMQARIDSLEMELAQVSTRPARSTSFPFTIVLLWQVHLKNDEMLPAGVQFYAGPPLAPRNVPADAFTGGLALNTHGELRFYGPTSSYRAVLADHSSISASQIDAARTFSLTRAPIHGATPADPALPRKPPVLTEAFRDRLIKMAFAYCLSGFGLGQEVDFCNDLKNTPWDRTANYSPFLLNVVLAVGCRYLDPKEDWPAEICSDMNDRSTRGDTFCNWARYLLDQEWYHPRLSTVTALGCLSIYLAGRGLDGPCWMFSGQSMRLVEDFGLHLGIHRLTMGRGGVADSIIETRRKVFYSAFTADVILSMYIGRSTTFTVEEIDQAIPPVCPEEDLVQPMHRTSAFFWMSKLIMIAAKMMSSLFALKPGIALASRQAVVPSLHLELETWYHQLPSHLRATTSTVGKAPEPFVICLNLMYFCICIQLHRPFFRRVSPDQGISVSTEKCLLSAKHVVRLVKLHRAAHGLLLTSPMVQHAMFCGGTILALSASEDGVSGPLDNDAERRAQAKIDLNFLVKSLQEAGETWTTAHTSASVLEALTTLWSTENPPPIVDDAGMDSFWSSLGDSSANGFFPFTFPSWSAEGNVFDDFMANVMQ